jgi:uncharacterized protein (TIGR03435 family)
MKVAISVGLGLPCPATFPLPGEAVRYFAIAVLALCNVGLFAGQNPPAPEFDVASIKRNNSVSDMGGGGPRPGGLYRLTNMPARSIAAVAWGMPTDRVLGAPDWAVAERYDIDARSKDAPTQAETRSMLQALLRDRFQLKAHIEMRDLPVYLLTPVRRDGVLGPGLRRSDIDCADPAARAKINAQNLPPGRMVCGFSLNAGVLNGGSMALVDLQPILTSAAGRPVLDRTGISGKFDIDLKWATGTPEAATDTVSIFTALQEQLGLRLDAATAPLEVLVVDHIDRPSEN